MVSLKIHMDDLDETNQCNNSSFSFNDMTTNVQYVDVNNLNLESSHTNEKKKNKNNQKSLKKNTLDKFVDVKG